MTNAHMKCASAGFKAITSTVASIARTQKILELWKSDAAAHTHLAARVTTKKLRHKEAQEAQKASICFLCFCAFL